MIVHLRQQLLERQQRAMLRIAGDVDTCRQSAEQCITELTQVWPELDVIRFGHEGASAEKTNDIRIKKYRALLGQECDLLVFDVFAGLNADALAALTGMLRAGGLCVLLTPTDSDWLSFLDPEKQKLCVAPYSVQQVSNWFERRFIDLLNRSPACLNYPSSMTQEAFDHFVQTPKLNVDVQGTFPNGAATKEQAEAVSNITTALVNNFGATLLIADRGRGKSAALGLSVAELFRTSDKPMNLALVSGNSDSVQMMFYHIKEQLTSHKIPFSSNKHTISTGDHQLRFVPPDQIETHVSAVDAVLVDEAAAIPVFMLEPIFSRQITVVLATTVSGYEGTGRAFEYKLKPKLRQCYANFQELTLQIPIRWSESDALEPLVRQLLALDTELPTSPCPLNGEMALQLEQVDSRALFENESLLSDVFALLVNAHYQTKPSDLRTLLDAPNMSVWIMRHNDSLVAAMLVAKEGPIDDELVVPIWRGERRPRGHLFPQSMICHAGFKSAAAFTFLRVVRIAVHPELQGQGIGTEALRQLALAADTFDFLCTSFGAENKLQKFWLDAGFVPVRKGLKKEKATGEQTLMMAKALNSKADAALTQWSERHKQQYLCEQLLRLRDEVHAVNLSSALNAEMTSLDREDLVCFVQHHRPLDSVWLPLWRLTQSQANSAAPSLSIVLDNADNLKTAVAKLGCNGEKQLLKQLKSELAPTIIDWQLIKK